MKNKISIAIAVTLAACAGYDDSQHESEPLNLELGQLEQALSVSPWLGWGPLDSTAHHAQWNQTDGPAYPRHIAAGKNVRFDWAGPSGSPGGKNNAWWKLRFTTAIQSIQADLGSGSGWTFAEQAPPNGQPGPGVLFLYPTATSIPQNPPRTRYINAWPYNWTSSFGFRHVNQCIIDFDTTDITTYNAPSGGSGVLWVPDATAPDGTVISFEAMRAAAVENAFMRGILHCMGLGNWGKTNRPLGDFRQVMNYYDANKPYTIGWWFEGQSMHLEERDWLRTFQPLN